MFSKGYCTYSRKNFIPHFRVRNSIEFYHSLRAKMINIFLRNCLKISLLCTYHLKLYNINSFRGVYFLINHLPRPFFENHLFSSEVMFFLEFYKLKWFLRGNKTFLGKKYEKEEKLCLFISKFFPPRSPKLFPLAPRGGGVLIF